MNAPQISLARATDNRTEPSDLATVHGIIVGGTLSGQTAAIRSAPDHETRNMAKRVLPGFIAAGVFAERRRDAWQSASGLLVADFDHVTELDRLRASLASDPCVALAFTSPSGTGCKAVVRVPVDNPDPAQHARAFAAAERWAREIHGAELDPTGKDPARLCYMAHDPSAALRNDPVPLDLDQWAPPEPVRAPLHRDAQVIPEDEAARRALAYVRQMPASVQGNNGSAAMMAVVRTLRDGFDLSGASLWRVLETWNGERADPAWSRAELEHAMGSVEREPPKRGRGWLLQSENPATIDTTPWPKLEPLDRVSDPPPFDYVTMLPDDVPELSRFVAAVAESVQVPQDLVAGAAMGLVALACARSVEVACSPEWREPAPVWVVALLRPGERKSASMGILASPFHKWMAAERQTMAEPVARYLEQRRGMEARLIFLRSKAAKANGEARTGMETEVSDLAADLSGMPETMGAPDLLVQSFTPEGLRDAMEANGEKLGIVSAEVDAGELLGARYSDAGPNLDLMLCAHAGDAITTRRASGRTVPLERPALGMVLAVQPEAVRTVLTDRAAKGRGLVDRMLLIHPPSRMGSRVLDPPRIGADLELWWSISLGAILDLPWPGRVIIGHDGLPVRCTSEQRTLSIDPEARALLWELRATLEPRLGEGGDLANVSGFASKLPGACARLALAFTMLRDPKAEVVEREAMRAACAWAPYLLAHHRAVLGDAVESRELHHARRLCRTLQRCGRSVMTGRDLFKLVHDSALPDMEAFRAVLALLIEHGALRPMPKETSGRGRPAERYAVHPSILPAGLSDKSDRIEGGGGAP